MLVMLMSPLPVSPSTCMKNPKCRPQLVDFDTRILDFSTITSQFTSFFGGRRR
jgi:hypothetical protein